MDWNKLEIINFLYKYEETKMFQIKELKNKNLVSRAQQKFYFWYVVDIIWNFHGMSPVETHELIKLTFWLETTTNLSTSEFKTLIELIQDFWKTKFNCIIPNPKDIKDEESLFKSLEF